MENNVKNSPKEFWALLIIPMEMILGNLLGKIPAIKASPNFSLALVIFLAIVAFLITIISFRKFLASQWRLYWTKWGWLKFLINIGLVFLAALVLKWTRFVVESLTISTKQLLISSGINILITAIPPFLAAFAEEITFRYLLFGKINQRTLKVIMFFVSSALFGLAHLANFNFDVVQTIPYMILGGYFALIYFFYDNIWGSIFTHWMFNSMNIVWPALVMIFQGITMK
ncbi:lysostaphin resistance A-like protein [Enterococcus sp. 2201sp1_2201st1_B8_2201SCRN_220225]|uniref:lysostaphin resistance A-like protein n=1 Tax=Enterococcus sp. 2201sp1_2201st1_B8_2201SCRN_220225 TaxID=3141592 RepID=UPI0034A1B92D